MADGPKEHPEQRKDLADIMLTLQEQRAVGMGIMQEMRVVYANEALARITGYRVDEIYAYSPDAIQRTVLPPERHQLWSLAEALEQRKDSGSAQLVVPIRHQDGSFLLVRVVSGPCTYAGKPALYFFLLEVGEQEDQVAPVLPFVESGGDEQSNSRWQEILHSVLQGEEELRSARDHLRELARYHQDLEERQRAELAKDVHDGLGQVITTLKMELSWSRDQLSQGHTIPDLEQRFDELITRADDAIAQVRRLARQLRPRILDELGLGPALEWLTEDVQSWSRLPVSLELDPVEPQLHDPVSTAVFRIAQEALTNIVRHAQATQIRVSLRQFDAGWELCVEDNGKGIDPGRAADRSSFGIHSMRERARAVGGRLSIAPGREGGTRLLFRLVLPSAPEIRL